MAMKVNELMVGDWVNMGNPVTDELVPTKIENIYGEEINCKTDHTSDDVPTIIYGEWLRYAQPIPLTEDILVKNGFDCQYYDDGNSYWWAVFDGWFNINFDHSDCSEGEFRCVNFRDLVIKSVHQLQHLLRLCGIEKEIELCPTKSTGRPTRPRWRKRCCR